MQLKLHPRAAKHRKAKEAQAQIDLIDTGFDCFRVLLYVIKCAAITAILRFAIWLAGISGVEIPKWLAGLEGISILFLILVLMGCLANNHIKDAIYRFAGTEKFQEEIQEGEKNDTTS